LYLKKLKLIGNLSVKSFLEATKELRLGTDGNSKVISMNSLPR